MNRSGYDIDVLYGCFSPNTADHIMFPIAIRWQASDLAVLTTAPPVSIASRSAISTTSSLSFTLPTPPTFTLPSITVPTFVDPTSGSSSGSSNDDTISSGTKWRPRIGGIVVAVVVILVAIIAVFWRRHKQKKARERQAGAGVDAAARGMDGGPSAKVVDDEENAIPELAATSTSTRGIGAGNARSVETGQNSALTMAELPVSAAQSPLHQEVSQLPEVAVGEGLEVSDKPVSPSIPDSGLIPVPAPESTQEREALIGNLNQLQDQRQRILALNAIDEEEARIRRRLDEIGTQGS
jgi:hypothetical protein